MNKEKPVISHPGNTLSLTPWMLLSAACILVALSSSKADKPAAEPAATLGQTSFDFAVFSPNGQTVLTNSDKTSNSYLTTLTAMLWDVKTGRLVRRFVGGQGSVFAGAFSPDGNQIVTGGGTGHSGMPGPANAELRLWDVASGREIRQFRGHKRIVRSISFSADGKRILSVSDVARLWDAQSGRQLFVWPKEDGQSVRGAELSNDGRSVLTNESDHVSIWDTSSGKQLTNIQRPSRFGSFAAAHFSPDAKLVATSSSDKTARIWDAGTGRQVQVFEGHTGYVLQARFSADGKWLATGSYDKTVRIWDVATARQIRTFSLPERRVADVRFSPDSTRLVAVWRVAPEESPPFLAGISLWDTQSGKELRRITTRNDQVDPGPAVFSPDGKTILVHLERTELLDCETGKTIREYN
jgi:WD40 repeat protein